MFFEIRDQVEVQMRDVLVGSAVSDQAVAVCLQFEALDQDLNGLEEIIKEIGVHRRKIG